MEGTISKTQLTVQCFENTQMLSSWMQDLWIRASVKGRRVRDVKPEEMESEFERWSSEVGKHVSQTSENKIEKLFRQELISQSRKNSREPVANKPTETKGKRNVKVTTEGEGSAAEKRKPNSQKSSGGERTKKEQAKQNPVLKANPKKRSSSLTAVSVTAGKARPKKHL